MVYADVPEHEGFHDGTAEPTSPSPVSTNEWLERISNQLQVFVDAINDAREGADDPDDDTDAPEKPETPADGADAKPADDKGGDKSPAPAAKKTTASKAEVKGD